MNITDIRLIHAEKKRFLALLLLADEQESMIDRYLERGDLFVWFETPERPAAVAVMTAMDRPGVYELKNLAVRPDLQGKGYGKAFIRFLWGRQSLYPTLLRTLRLPLFASDCRFLYPTL